MPKQASLVTSQVLGCYRYGFNLSKLADKITLCSKNPFSYSRLASIVESNSESILVHSASRKSSAASYLFVRLTTPPKSSNLTNLLSYEGLQNKTVPQTVLFYRV